MKTSKLRLLLCLALLWSVCDCSLAVGKITVDPNTGGSTAPKVLAASDARLAQKATYEAQYRSVQQILGDLSEMTGVKLYAGANKSDWPVRSRKMNIFVKDVKMADLMNSIARVMKFRWSRNDEIIPPTYRLIVDKKAAIAAAAQKARGEKLHEEMWRKRRQRWLDVIMRDGAMTDAQIDALRDTDPIFYRTAKPGALRGLRALFEEVPETKNAFADGRNFRISADKLNGRTWDLLFSAADEFLKFLQGGRGQERKGLGDTFKPDDKLDIVYCRLDVNTFTPNLRWSVHSQFSTGYFHVVRGDRDWEISDPKDMDSDWIRTYCVRESKILDGQATFRSAYPELEATFPQLIADRAKEEESLYPSEPLNEHPDFAELDKTVKLKFETPKTGQDDVMAINDHIAQLQKTIAAATGLGIVSDSWVSIEGDRLPDQEATLSELLDKFSKQFNYNWDKSSDILEFRHRKWWKNRLNQIPDDWVAAWSENTRKDRILSLNDLAAISNLDYYQAEESLKRDKVVGSAGIYDEIVGILDTNGNLHWLRLYSTLSPQLRALLGEQGINGQMLTSEQWKQAQAVFDRIGSSRSDAIFRMEHSKSFNRYTFKEIDNDTGEVDREWLVRLPKYEPPPDQKDAP